MTLVLAAALLLSLWGGAAEEALEDKALLLLERLKSDDTEAMLPLMTPEMQKAAPQLEGLWRQLEGLGGAFEAADPPIRGEEGGYRILWINLRFASAAFTLRFVFDGSGLLAGLFAAPGEHPSAAPIPEDVTEKDITVDAEQGYPLAGKLALPQGEPAAVALLIPGSGPNDMDERIGANAPFRDLAHGLARRGIASLRWHKRTYAYAAKIAASPGISASRRRMSTGTPLAAIRLVGEDPLLRDRPLYLLGHSLGASVLPYIDGAAGWPATGYILLAGTPRGLLDLIIEQNRLVKAELAQADEEAASQADAAIAQLESLRDKLPAMSAEECLDDKNGVGGLSAYYLRHLHDLHTAESYRQADKPTLVLWGEKDRQVYQEDFDLWRSSLSGLKDARFKAYPALNHLMGAYQGAPVPFTQLLSVEYGQRTPPAEEVMDDIAAFIRERPGR